MAKQKYYSLKNILSKGAHYNLIIGERSNGKTYSVLKHGLERALQNGEQMAIVRRWQDDFRGKRGASMFDALVVNKEVERLSGGEWTGVYYYAGRWYFCRYDDGGQRVPSEDPFAYAFSISSMEHDKSTSYPNVKTILFDEFLSRQNYLPDEFMMFMNVLSTIIRQRDDVTIFMLGNTVNKYCPYFGEMGLTHVKDMKPGDIDVYQYGDGRLKVAVEFSDNPNKGKPSDLYFAFNNPKLNMITGKGSVWELAVYPHKPCKFRSGDISFTFFIQFDGELLQCEIVTLEEVQFVFIHRKTTPLRHPDRDLIYSPDYDPRPNWRRKITIPMTNLEQKVVRLFKMDKVYYQDNEVGEVVHNYLMWCGGGK